MNRSWLQPILKLLNPEDPRGRVQFRELPLPLHGRAGGENRRTSDRKGTATGNSSIYTTGMSSLKRGDLFMTAVPADLQREAQSLLLAILKKLPLHPIVRIKQSEELLAEGQPCRHRFSLLQMDPIDADQRELFAVVDAGATAVDFPRRLFAAHLIALGDRSPNPIAAEGMFQRAINIFPGDDSATAHEGERKGFSADDFEDDNENNCLAYYGLANALGDQGDAVRALELMQKAVARSPRWARANQERIRAAIPKKEQRHIVDPLARFWLDVSIP